MYIFWMSNAIYQWKLVTSGLGMAVYRVICFKCLFKKRLNTNSMARKIMAVEWIVTAGAILTFATLFCINGWEKVPNSLMFDVHQGGKLLIQTRRTLFCFCSFLDNGNPLLVYIKRDT